MKWQFPRKVADKTREILGKAKKQLRRYTFNKEGARELGNDVKKGANYLNDRLNTAMEREDPIYTEPVHRPPEVNEDKVLTRGPVDYYFLFIVVALCLFGAVMAFSASSV